MRGHEPVIALRRRGIAPRSVWLCEVPVHSGLCGDWMLDSPDAHVELLPSESAARLDLRFLVGLRVHIQTEAFTRLQALETAAVEAGALRVLGAVVGPAGDCQVMTDTKGEIVWQA
jgi:hypothetical protein